MEPFITVERTRTKSISVSFGVDISADSFVSEIRTEKNSTSTLIATWSPTFLTDGTDGELVLTLDNDDTAGITQTKGYMDIKRLSGGEPIAAHNGIIVVYFKDVVTA